MNPSYGGPCQGIRNSIPKLEELGVYNEVVTLDDPADILDPSDSFPIHTLGPAKSPWSYSERLVPWLLENLHRFDVVIIHGLWLYHGYAVMRAMRRLESTAVVLRANGQSPLIPRIYVMPHGMMDPYFQRDPSRRLKAVRNWIYWKFIESKIVNDSYGVLFTCEEELRLARETFLPYRPQRECNVSYGITEPPSETEAMAEAFSNSCHVLGDRPYLLFLSRIHQKKGVDLLIRAYAALANTEVGSGGYGGAMSGKSDHQSDGEVRPFPSLVIAGPLDSAYALEMQRLAGELMPDAPSPPAAVLSQATDPLFPTIVFTGMLKGDAKWGAFHGCEAFILPSHQENFGIAIVEALACAKPVLISNKINIWREIEIAGGGLVSPDTAEGTCDLLSRWLSLSATDRTTMSLSARGCYLACYQIESAARRLASTLAGNQ
jgi:glycosyltransferase involved in cell wall biosynthesis